MGCTSSRGRRPLLLYPRLELILAVADCAVVELDRWRAFTTATPAEDRLGRLVVEPACNFAGGEEPITGLSR